MKVELTPTAAAELERLPNVVHARVFNILIRLADWPNVSGAKPLRGKLAGHYRVRTGDYRVQFSASGQKLIVEKIGHRDGFYED
jgi:mRNA-degrading endonuclease RelE of RelBE toxin-antitoxin system